MRIDLSPDSLVMLVGASGSGKSFWAASHFPETAVVSSDRCRALVSDDETDQTVNRQAFAVFYTIIRQRLALGRLTVADSTALQPHPRRRIRELGQLHGSPVHAVVFLATPGELARNNHSRRRRVPQEVLARHSEMAHELLRSRVLEAEGYASVCYLTPEEARRARPRVRPPAPTLPG